MSTKRARCLVLSVVCLLSCAFAESAFAVSEISVVREWDDVEIPSGGSFGFGLAPANTPDSRRFRIHNTGNTNLVVSNPTTLVSGEGFSMIAEPVGTVHAGMSTTFRVQFLASAPGDYHGAITIQSNDADENPFVIHLYGGVTAPPSPDIAVVRNWDDVAVPSGGSFSFGTEPANTPDSRIFRINNTGNLNLNISNPTTLVSGDAFSMIAYPVGTVHAGEFTSFRVQFLASAPGDYNGAITIQSNDPDENPYVINLHGAVNPPAGLPDIAVVRNWDDVAVPSGGSFSFGTEPANTPDSRIFRIHNTGNANLNISNPTTLVSGDGFSMIAYPVGTVSAGESTSFRVQFLASAPGDYNGAITIHSNDPNENPYVINLHGAVNPPPSPDIGVVRNWDDVAITSGGSFSFGTEPANTPDSRIFRIHNTGETNLNISNPTTLVSGDAFSMIAFPTGTVHVGDSTIFRVQFLASTPGDYYGVITIHSNDPDENPYVIHLHGAVTAPSQPEIAVFRDWDNVAVPDGGSFTFPNPVVAGTDSRRFRITNTGNAPLTLGNPATLVSGTCFSQMETPANPIAPGASAWFQVRIHCTTPGTYTATVSIQNNDADENPYDFTVTATVVPPPPQAPEITLFQQWDNVAVPDGGSFVYPAPIPSGQADLRTFRIENRGGATLTIANPGSLVSGTCFSQSGVPPASSIAPGASTTFTVQVLCNNAGTYNGAVTIQNNDDNENPYDVALQVEISTGDFNVSVRPDFMRVQRGKSVTAAVSIAGLFGFNSPVSLSVVDLPAGTTASFQPASILPGGSSTLTIHAASSGPFGDFSIRVRGTSGGVTRNMTATFRVMDPQAKPAITAIQPETVPAGETSTVTLTGVNLHTSEVTVGNANTDRTFPTINVVDVSADGTRMVLQVDATDPAVLHHYGLYVKNFHGEDGISFRVIPAAPVIDYWSPSEAAGGTVYAMDLVGINLQGAVVVSPGGGVSVFDVDNSEDEILSAFLKVEDGAPNGPIHLTIRGRNGGDATIRVEIHQQRSTVKQKTSAMTNSKGETLFYMQDLKPREDLLQTKLTKNPASVNGGFDFQICADWGRSRSRGRVWTRTWFKNPLTGQYAPLADVILANLTIGDVRLLETTTFSRWFFLELSMHFRVCFSEDSGFDWDVEACITGEAGFHIPIVGGVAFEFEFCLGSPNRYEIDLTGTGFLSFIQFHRRGDTGPEPLQCVQIRDVNPESGSGERIFQVELLSCCAEEVGAAWSGDFYVGTMVHPNQQVGTATPAPTACPLHTVTIDHPEHNPNPPDLADNFSFLAQRRFAEPANGDTIEATATVTPAVNDLDRMTWTITPDRGAVRLLTNGRGATVSFVPDPPDHPDYVGGTGCNNRGNGSCDRSTPLGYLITARYEDHQAANRIRQDQIDIIRQEYRNHGITVPRRSEFNTVFPTLHFDVADINHTAYDIVVGTPGTVAESVLDEFNWRIHDDEQREPVGRSGLPPTTVVVAPGLDIQWIPAILTTPLCNGAPNPATCDDEQWGDVILAGNNGIAETRAVHRRTNLLFEITSGWRNPERNEAFNGVRNSDHQYGGAVDLGRLAPAEGLTTAQLYCILQTAALSLGYEAYAEQGSTERRCTSPLVDHVHVEPRR